MAQDELPRIADTELFFPTIFRNDVQMYRGPRDWILVVGGDFDSWTLAPVFLISNCWYSCSVG
jgi:hypothetical protein